MITDTENGFIGKLLVDSSAIKKAYGKLTPDMFYSALCRDAYKEFLREYDRSGKPIDLNSLVQRMENEHVDKETLNKWAREVVQADNYASTVQGYIEVITNEYKARRVRQIVDSIDFTPKGIETTVSDLLGEFEALKDNKQRASHSLAEITKKNKSKYFVEHDEGVQTGISSLDEILLGLGKGDVTIIGARPSVGKSALATQIITTVAKAGRRVGYFNLEMNDSQIYERIVASHSGIDLNRIRRAVTFLNDEEKKYNEAVEELEKATNLEIFSGSYTANEIKHLCRNMDFDLVVIDYLQIVKPDKSYGNRVAEVGDISKTIKALAMELKIPVIALSQLNRRKSATDEPELNDLRESGDIEQDASTIMFMWNIDEHGNYKGLSVAKNRQGINGKIALQFDGSHMRFTPSVDDVETLTQALGGKSFKANDTWSPF